MIPRRFGHTGTLSSDGQKIFIFGGLINPYDLKLTNDTINLAVLGIETLKWTRPIISDLELGPNTCLADHSATLYNDFLIFAFGYQNYNLSNHIYILDVKNEAYHWVRTIARINLQLKGNITISNHSNSKNLQSSDPQGEIPMWVIVFLSISGFVFIVFAGMATLVFLQGNRKKAVKDDGRK
ncbi:7596_t:CDS:2 [Ambispora leptoticha]|uniref:7596_t:CDS:1 n=1 Tax=Ambispora leptoticha TaxID=144679 RepID=A0A9N9GG43_9GLOM|nr:7596_t:CDS:2 [Ambispora leptoticha]